MRALGLITVVVLALTIQRSSLVGVGGKANNRSTECLVRFEGPRLNHPARNPRMVKCVDNDPTCDSDPTPGQCVFTYSVRFNTLAGDMNADGFTNTIDALMIARGEIGPSHPAFASCDLDGDGNCNTTDALLLARGEVPSSPCGPRDLESYVVQNYQPDTHPRHDFGLEALEVAGNMKLPLDSSETQSLSDPVSVGLLLKVQPRVGSARWRTLRKLLRGRVNTEDGKFDVDQVKLSCVPNKESSPCDGVTGTFDQIQKQVLSRGCAVPTCHTAPVPPHNLSLLLDDAFVSLVDAAPANATAAALGKRRVDPFNPENSYLLDKLRGRLPSEEGERMPLGKRKLHRLFLEIVEEWIAAGAPAEGFVSATGCQP